MTNTNESTNPYEQRLQDKRERLLERAGEAQERSERLYEQGRDMGKHLPFGQPVLVGHHSEGKHRRILQDLRRLDRRSLDEAEKGRDLAEHAERVGTGGISSDDPEALTKLREQLAEMEARQVFMKSANAAMRKLKTADERVAALLAMGVDDWEASHTGRRGKYTFDMTNNNANIRRVAKRIEELEQMAGREAVEVEGNGWSYYEDLDDNRICFEFSGKPDEDARHGLKARGFKWAPSRGAWVRQRTANGLQAAVYVVRFLQARDEAPAA